jgi:hypothetical protein
MKLLKYIIHFQSFLGGFVNSSGALGDRFHESIIYQIIQVWLCAYRIKIGLIHYPGLARTIRAHV